MLLVFLALSAAIAVAVASYFYDAGLKTFLAQKADEKATALQLVDAFVTTYSGFGSEFGQNAPVPATFRAHSIERFNKQLGPNSAFTLRWVGRQGRHIATPPVDAEMARTIEEFVTTTDRHSKSELMTIDGRRVLRTIYPSVAAEQACVTCHNQLQPDRQWRLNDVMGAFAIDIPVDTYLGHIRTRSYTIAFALFTALAGIGLAVSILNFQQLSRRETTAAQLQLQNIRFNAALGNMTQGLCMFDAERRLVVCNERYARLYGLPPELVVTGTSHEAIIKHRVSHGILAGETSDGAVDKKLAALSSHSTEKTSIRVDKLADGRLIKVTPRSDA